MDASDLIKHCKTPCEEGAVHIWAWDRFSSGELDRGRLAASRNEQPCI